MIMEDNFKTSRNKYFVQKVGSAVQFEKGTDKEHFRCILNKNDLLKCTRRVHKNRETAKDYEVLNLSLKSLNDQVPSPTHLVTDSLYHKNRIEDNSVEVNLHLDKGKISAAKVDRNGLIYVTAELNNKNTGRDFNLLDYRTYLTDEKGEKLQEKSYIGYAHRVDHEKDYKREHIYERRIEREFIGSGFIVQDDNYSRGQALTVKTNKERLLETTSNYKQYIYINIIPVKNNPQQMAAYVTKDKNDKSAKFIFRLDKEKVLSMQANEEGYIKFSGYFDDNAKNNCFNITVTENLSKRHDIPTILPKEIGIGADKGNIQCWQELSYQRDSFATRDNLNTGKNFNL